jgi:hypothetical protein
MENLERRFIAIGSGSGSRSVADRPLIFEQVACYGYPILSQAYVELLANVCVTRAMFGGETTLGEETVVDILV